jgi:hypothetical protein
MTRRLFLLSLMLASMVVLPISVKAMETVEYGPYYSLGGEGTLIIRGQNGFEKGNVSTCLIFGISEDGDLMVGQMNISGAFSGDVTMYFTASVDDKGNLHITFDGTLYNAGGGIISQDVNAFADGTYSDDKKNKQMNFILKIPNLGVPGYGAFTGNFELTEANAETFCPEP